MESSGITPVMNVGGYGDGCGWGGNSSFIWLFAILALMNGGFGGWGGRDGRCATVEDLNNSANFTRLESQVQNNGNAIAQGFTNLGNGICSLGYQLATDFGALEKEIADCCCQNQLASKQIQFDMANYAAAINANVTAQVQSVKDMLCAEKAAALQAQVNKLEMEKMFCGVVRYPTSATYNAGYPFYYNSSCGCGCTNI